jgi:hypothetical protein
MDRRRFTTGILGAAGGLALGPWVPGALAAHRPRGRDTPGREPPTWTPDLRVDAARLNRTLEELAPSGGGWRNPNRRVAYSDGDLQGRAYVRELMEAAGLSTRIDAAGNLLGIRSGSEAGLPSLMTGSHIDSVPTAGTTMAPWAFSRPWRCPDCSGRRA